MTELAVQVVVRRLPLSRASVKVLRHLKNYDHIVFTSKNARKFFLQELKERRIPAPPRSRTIQVGPRVDLLQFPLLSGKRILFPRSAIAPHDIVRRLRARGVVVRVLPLYNTSGTPLTPAQKRALVEGKVQRIYFKSPSGVFGFLGQLRGHVRQAVFAVPARCIGQTTAHAARKMGFKKVFIR